MVFGYYSSYWLINKSFQYLIDFYPKNYLLSSMADILRSVIPQQIHIIYQVTDSTVLDEVREKSDALVFT